MTPKVNPLKNQLVTLYDKLRGIRYGDNTVVELELDSATSRDYIEDVISEINNRCVLKFYDAFYDLPPEESPTTRGDLGAFTEVRKNGKSLFVRMGNHGGYKCNGEWIKISSQELVDRIYNSRTFNSGKMTLNSRLVRRQWRKIEDGYALYEYYHDISDKLVLTTGMPNS